MTSLLPPNHHIITIWGWLPRVSQTGLALGVETWRRSILATDDSLCEPLDSSGGAPAPLAHMIIQGSLGPYPPISQYLRSSLSHFINTTFVNGDVYLRVALYILLGFLFTVVAGLPRLLSFNRAAPALYCLILYWSCFDVYLSIVVMVVCNCTIARI